ncbi:unnamed protein product [Allacma fusca]|uniref:Uncharacterized protein n=1 Tax=Allacma fusca TaxID=39272 RepID=A0A8J2NYN0_9HEXA|nr:unnamed protein product [Allacma fusca]
MSMEAPLTPLSEVVEVQIESLWDTRCSGGAVGCSDEADPGGGGAGGGVSGGVGDGCGGGGGDGGGSGVGIGGFGEDGRAGGGGRGSLRVRGQ